MSKFLKFIVHFIIICFCICALGLFVPQFFGITTVVMDNEDTLTNLPMGSVTYAIPVKAEDIKIGDPILVQEDSKTYRYKVASLDLENHTGTVVNPAASGNEPITVSIRAYLPKVVITIGLVGYLLVAARSTEGLMIAGLVVLALIILYVLSEILRKDPDKEEPEVEELEPGQLKSGKQLKKEDSNRSRKLKEEAEILRLEERRLKKENKKYKTNKKMIRTGGFVDEIEDDDEEEIVEDTDQTMQTATAASEAHELLKKEIAAATAEDETPAIPIITFEEKAKDKTKDIVAEVKAQKMQKEEEVLTPEEIGKLAIPVYTASQLADQAKKAGDNPDLIRDDITEVAIFDYSDLI